MSPKLFIGPMSKNIVDAIIEYCNSENRYIGLIASRRQIDYNGGYVNNWTTDLFVNYVKTKSNNIILVRDHAGPLQGEKIDDGYQSIIEDSIYFDLIHIDVWKKYKDIKEGSEMTKKYIKKIHEVNPNVKFEIGTEESIRKFSPHEIEYLLNYLFETLTTKEFKNIEYVVVQSGTELLGVSNIGKKNHTQLVDMIDICQKKGKKTKIHNGDFLEYDIIKEKFDIGVDGINIAPEFGQIETNVVLDYFKKDENFLNYFFEICLKSKKWEKWVTKDFVPEENKLQLIQICGHYVFSNYEFLKISKNTNFYSMVYEKIENKLNRLFEII